jgi:hypothetical protein
MSKKATNLMSGGEEKDMSVIMTVGGRIDNDDVTTDVYVGYVKDKFGSLNRHPYWIMDGERIILKEISYYHYEYKAEYANYTNICFAEASTPPAGVDGTITVIVNGKKLSASVGSGVAYGYGDYDILGLEASLGTSIKMSFTPPQTDSYKFGKRHFLCGGGVNEQESCFDDGEFRRCVDEGQFDIDCTRYRDHFTLFGRLCGAISDGICDRYFSNEANGSVSHQDRRHDHPPFRIYRQRGKCHIRSGNSIRLLQQQPLQESCRNQKCSTDKSFAARSNCACLRIWRRQQIATNGGANV